MQVLAATYLLTDNTRLTGAQEPRLLQTKKEIEDRFETEKWQKIADGIEAKGGIKYPASAVQKKFKELSSA